MRAARQVRPTVIFLENVVGFIKYLPLLANDFQELGYYFNWSQINSNILWVQSRPRIYMIASLGKQFEFRPIRSCPVDCRLILETEAKFRYPSETAWTWLQKRKAAGHTGKWGYQEVNRYCPTLTTKNDRIFVNQRYLTLNELKQIQGFPINFQFPVSRTQAEKQIGNSVCVPVVEHLAVDIALQFFSK